MTQPDPKKLQQITNDARRVSRLFARGPIDNDDIAQEVVIYQLGRGDTEKMNWATVRSRSIDALRKHRRKQKRETDAVRHSEQVYVARLDEDDETDKKESREEAVLLINLLFAEAKLSQRQHIVLQMHYGEEYSILEISEVWEWGEDVIKRELENGMDKIRRVLWKLR